MAQGGLFPKMGPPTPVKGCALPDPVTRPASRGARERRGPVSPVSWAGEAELSGLVQVIVRGVGLAADTYSLEPRAWVRPISGGPGGPRRPITSCSGAPEPTPPQRSLRGRAPCPLRASRDPCAPSSRPALCGGRFCLPR